jgi:hypothetical protein
LTYSIQPIHHKPHKAPVFQLLDSLLLGWKRFRSPSGAHHLKLFTTCTHLTAQRLPYIRDSTVLAPLSTSITLLHLAAYHSRTQNLNPLPQKILLLQNSKQYKTRHNNSSPIVHELPLTTDSCISKSLTDRSEPISEYPSHPLTATGGDQRRDLRRPDLAIRKQCPDVHLSQPMNSSQLPLQPPPCYNRINTNHVPSTSGRPSPPLLQHQTLKDSLTTSNPKNLADCCPIYQPQHCTRILLSHENGHALTKPFHSTICMADHSSNGFSALQEPDDDKANSSPPQEGWDDDLPSMDSIPTLPLQQPPSTLSSHHSKLDKQEKKAKKRQKSLKVKLPKTPKPATGQELCKREIAWLNSPGPTSLQKAAMCIGFPSKYFSSPLALLG